jgi:hypothetical protein
MSNVNREGDSDPNSQPSVATAGSDGKPRAKAKVDNINDQGREGANISLLAEESGGGGGAIAISDKASSDSQQKKTSSSDEQQKRDGGGISESTDGTSSARKRKTPPRRSEHPLPPAALPRDELHDPPNRRNEGQRSLLESALEQKRRLSRESSRRSQERQKKRIESLTKEEINLRSVNQALMEENQQFREARLMLQHSITQREVQAHHTVAAATPALSLQVLGWLGIGMNNPQAMAQQQQQQQHQPLMNMGQQQVTMGDASQTNINPVISNLLQTMFQQLTGNGPTIMNQGNSSGTTQQHLLEALNNIGNVIGGGVTTQQQGVLQSIHANQLQAFFALLSLLNNTLNQQQNTTPMMSPLVAQQQQQLQHQQQLPTSGATAQGTGIFLQGVLSSSSDQSRPSSFLQQSQIGMSNQLGQQQLIGFRCGGSMQEPQQEQGRQQQQIQQQQQQQQRPDQAQQDLYQLLVSLLASMNNQQHQQQQSQPNQPPPPWPPDPSSK